MASLCPAPCSRLNNSTWLPTPSHPLWRQLAGLHPLSLTLLDDAGAALVCCSVCGLLPCLEPAHMRLMTRRVADSIEKHLE